MSFFQAQCFLFSSIFNDDTGFLLHDGQGQQIAMRYSQAASGVYRTNRDVLF